MLSDTTSQNPLYNSTFTLYRVSPLYTGNASLFDATTLSTHAHRLRETLRGDALRGIYDGDLGGSEAKEGELQECRWRLLGREGTVLGQEVPREPAGREGEHEQDDDEGASGRAGTTIREARGIHIELRYPRATHTGILLRSSDEGIPTHVEHPGFISLPLLLLRLPAAVRDKMIEYLETSFDCRIAPLRLRSDFLASSLEGVLSRNERTDPSDSETAARDGESRAVGDVRIQLCFPSATPSLKNLDVTIAADDVSGFCKQGREISAAEKQTRQTSRTLSMQHSGREKDERSNPTGPFTAALSLYLKKHLALDLSHPGVVLSKVACTPFALDSQGKIKIFSPSSSTTTSPNPASQSWRLRFLDTLVQEAKGRGLLSVSEKTGEKRPLEATAQAVAGTEKRRKVARGATEEVELVERAGVPDEPPPPYEEVDPARGR
ncbi:hypothetical protein W97_08479 [Coniosporium apollinis CBS 100218]|uniref:Uncharacterized protein n=1 Tax=Coniosporium apollinis (strain CBS 100218) TaxID=1168221 RepID=R7Z4V7_CONA1|nr:uncharacterized protein W97_08479 [Coniosporium apollinis CBS 100218]EON69220.1 hypothetical protein W97_08479 [Coniosporium apollinis CBS 100218]